MQRLTTHIATHLVCCIIGTYCNYFMERLQYEPPMATKWVVLQSCGVALEVNPCSEIAVVFHRILGDRKALPSKQTT